MTRVKALARIRKPSHRGVQPGVGCRDLCVEPMRHQSVEPMRHQRTLTPNISTPWQREWATMEVLFDFQVSRGPPLPSLHYSLFISSLLSQFTKLARLEN